MILFETERTPLKLRVCTCVNSMVAAADHGGGGGLSYDYLPC
ncbi:hypothetical protein Hanom_Chr07g00587621 [Helianthus anomalus]